MTGARDLRRTLAALVLLGLATTGIAVLRDGAARLWPAGAAAALLVLAGLKAELILLAAKETGADSVAALQDEVTFGQNCQLCHPYVRRMLRTGEVAFDEVIRAEDEP